MGTKRWDGEKRRTHGRAPKWLSQDLQQASLPGPPLQNAQIAGTTAKTQPYGKACRQRTTALGKSMPFFSAGGLARTGQCCPTKQLSVLLSARENWPTLFVILVAPLYFASQYSVRECFFGCTA